MKAPEIIDSLLNEQFSFITGVPDSIFKDLLIEINSSQKMNHILSVNEGEACSMAAGYHLATGNYPIVYLQNSGLGNCLNPLTSLIDSHVYAIPELLFISWRGHPSIHDEPQHLRMGKILTDILNLLEVPYREVTNDINDFKSLLKEAKQHLQQKQTPFALLFRANVVDPVPKPVFTQKYPLEREKVLKFLVEHSKPTDAFVVTTGKASRELFEIREERGEKDHGHDFLTVGSMGCSSAIALGIAMYQKAREVFLIDADGAALMRMETLATIGTNQPANLIHVLIDNEVYESTGGQPTISQNIDF